MRNDSPYSTLDDLQAAIATEPVRLAAWVCVVLSKRFSHGHLAAFVDRPVAAALAGGCLLLWGSVAVSTFRQAGTRKT